MHLAVRLFVALVLLAHWSHAGFQTLWAQRFPSGTQSHTIRIARFDPAGNLVIAGEVTEPSTGADLWVAKLNKDNGTVMWSFRRDGAIHRNDRLGNITISSEGDVYVAGAIINDMLGPTTPDSDMYLARLKSADGSFVWERDSFGNPGVDGLFDVALDGDENPVITGTLENVEAAQSGDVWTAKIDKADGGFIWDDFFRSFDGFVQDQGERLFIAPNGDVFVQGWTEATTQGGVATPPAVLALSYSKDGVRRFARRFREGQNARAYGFIPNVNGGFIVGISLMVGNTPIHSVANNRADGSPGLEVVLPGVAGAPLINIASDDGDVLYSGRGPVGAVPPPIVSGRLDALDFKNEWTEQQPGQAVGVSTPFGHVVMGATGSVVAGVAPGANSVDILLAPYGRTGTPMGASFIDGALTGPEVTEQIPGALAADLTGDLGVVVQLATPAGERETLVRRMRFTNATGAPTVTLISPDPAELTVDAFTDFRFAVEALDPDGRNVSVEFFADGKPLGVDAEPPFEVTHRFDSVGTHTLTAVATDPSGLTGTTGPISVVAEMPTPLVTTGGAQRTGPTTGTFSGTVANLPLGGTARFLFRFSGATIGFTMNTEAVALPAGTSVQNVSIPFTFPEPHRAYDYFLEVTTTDGVSNFVTASTSQTFTIPNAPVIPAQDFVFVGRGAIRGQPLENDIDADAGEVLTISYGSGSFPGQFLVEGNRFTFIPNRDFTGELVINYLVDDGHGSNATQTLVLRNGLHYAGIYRALPPVDSARLGAVDVVVGRTGRATASVYLDGARFSVSGELKQQAGDNVGFSVPIRKKGQPDRALLLSWTGNRQFSAQLVEGESVLYSADGIRAAISELPIPQLYTLLGAHTNVGGIAGGRVTAFASLQIAPDGKVKFRGKLGDGTGFVTTSRLQENGRVPIYTPLQGRPASFLLGRFDQTETDATALAPGLVAVQGPVAKNTPSYAADYRDLVGFAGPRYVPPALGGAPLTFTANPRMMTLQASGGGISAPSFSLPVWLSRSGSVNGIIGITRVSIDGRTGEVSGAFLPQGRRRTLPFSGVLRADQNNAIGVFRGPDAAGEVQLAPQ